MATETSVLCLYVGGTIGMIKHPVEGYQPHASFLTETLRTQARFHDPFANSIFSWADSVDRYQMWSGVHSAAGSRNASPSRNTSGPASPSNVHFGRNSVAAVHEKLAPDNRVDPPGSSTESARGRGRVWPPFGSCVKVRSSSTKGISTLNARNVQEAECSSELESEANGSTKVLDMELPTLITPKGAGGKRVRYCVLEYDPLLDSSEVGFSDWKRLSRDIQLNYANFDAFIVLHGTDTMAYTASALSMLLENLGKSVIVTGAQVPLSELRNDAIENVLGALTIAGNYIIPEVTLYFASKLYRGNRTSKISNDALPAFDSPNMPPLANVGIDIDVNWQLVQRPREIRAFRAHTQMCEDVAIIRLFPGLPPALVRTMMAEPIQGVVLETFGAGNAPSTLLQVFREAAQRGVVIVNITQCLQGTVSSIYAAGKKLEDAGVTSGLDMTPECALIKLAYLLGKPELSRQDIRSLMGRSLRGEVTAKSPVVADEQDASALPGVQELVADILYQSNSSEVKSGASTASWSITASEIQSADRLILPHLIYQAVNDDNADALRHYLKKVERIDRASMMRTGDPNPTVGSVNLVDERQALHAAAAQGKTELVKILLTAGASVHRRDHFGFSPLFAAVRNGHKDVVILLKETGAHLKGDEEQILEQIREGRPEIIQAYELSR